MKKGINLILMPKDVGRVIVLKNVSYYFFDYGTLHVWFTDGLMREYPDRHIWYVESRKSFKKEKKHGRNKN